MSDKYYRIISARHADEMEEKINRLYDDGWRVQGGIVINPHDSISTRYSQAMIKYATGGIIGHKKFHVAGEKQTESIKECVHPLPEGLIGCTIPWPVTKMFGDDPDAS